MTKPGPIIGLIIGMLLILFPVVGMMTQESSLSDSKGKMIGFGLIILGAFMVIVNIIVLVTGKENILSSLSETPPREVSEKSSKPENSGKIRCRYCKKSYSSEYNGCPYCKKK